MGAIDSAVGAGLGLILGNYNDKRQLKQQGKLQAQQIQGQMELGKFNQQQALQMWNDTNYAAQRKQMEKAGLNVGLMYGSAGQGGTTQGAGAGSTTGGQAPQGGGEPGLGMQLGLQKAMTEAQIELAKSQAQKNRVETAKTAGVDTKQVETQTAEAGERIKLIGQQTKNAELQGAIMNYEKAMAKVDSEVKAGTQENAVQQIRLANEQAEQQIRGMKNTNEITDQTKQEVIKQIKTASIEQGLRIEAQKLGLVKTGADISAVNKGIAKMGAEIGKMSNDVLNKWKELDYHKQEIEIKKILMNLQTEMTEFNTSTPQEIKQWTGIISQFIPFAGGR